MSKVELILIVGLSVIPIIALFFVLPKWKKKKAEEKPKEEKPEEKFEMSKPAEESSPKVKTPEDLQVGGEFEQGDLADYISRKMKDNKMPKRKVLPDDFVDTSEDFITPIRRTDFRQKNEAKSLAEQFYELSPEMKALIIAGVFDKKDC